MHNLSLIISILLYYNLTKKIFSHTYNTNLTRMRLLHIVFSDDLFLYLADRFFPDFMLSCSSREAVTMSPALLPSTSQMCVPKQSLEPRNVFLLSLQTYFQHIVVVKYVKISPLLQHSSLIARHFEQGQPETTIDKSQSTNSTSPTLINHKPDSQTQHNTCHDHTPLPPNHTQPPLQHHLFPLSILSASQLTTTYPRRQGRQLTSRETLQTIHYPA